MPIVTRAARILIVDDDPLLQKSLTLFFMTQGYDVDSATTAQAAFDAIERQRPDLIVLDLGLPDLDGREVCRRVRQASDVPIIVLSARSGDQDKVSALEQGADDYVCKPFNSDELLARVRVALRRVASVTDIGRLDRGALVIDFDRRRVLLGGARNPADAERVRAAGVPGPSSQPRPAPPHHPDGDLGRARDRSPGATLGARDEAAEEDRARSGAPPLSPERTVGGLPARHRARPRHRGSATNQEAR